MENGARNRLCEAPEGPIGKRFLAPFSHGLSIDVEEYFQVESAADVIAPADWPNWPSRVVEATERVLGLLDDAGCRATFFILGWVAERQPALVRTIAEAGHELACHGFAHKSIRKQTPEDFRDDVRRAKHLIEDLGGRPVLGYRAPTFSIVADTLWALDVLIDEGFRYDSSIFPVRHDRYGIPDAPRRPFRIADCGLRIADCRRSFIPESAIRNPQSAILIELPPLTARVRGRNLPLAGGGYMRLLPLGAIRWAIRRAEREGFPAVIYLHPWELDPGQPRMSLTRANQFRHRVGLTRMARKLASLLRAFRFGPLADLAAAVVE